MHQNSAEMNGAVMYAIINDHKTCYDSISKIMMVAMSIMIVRMLMIRTMKMTTMIR